MDADTGAQEPEGKAAPNVEDGNKAESMSSLDIGRSAKYHDASDQGRSSGEVDRMIKKFDRMSRQPTVEDDDSDMETQKVSRTSVRDATSLGSRTGTFRRNQSQSSSSNHRYITPSKKAPSERREGNRERPQKITRFKTVQLPRSNNSLSSLERSSMMAQQSFTDTSSENDFFRVHKADAARKSQEPEDEYRTRFSSLPGASLDYTRPGSGTQSGQRYVDYTSVEEEEDFSSEEDDQENEWDLNEEEALHGLSREPYGRPAYPGRIYPASFDRPISIQISTDVPRHRLPEVAPNHASSETGSDDYSYYSQSSTDPGPRFAASSMPYPKPNPFYDAGFPGYASHPYPDPNARTFGQPFYPGHGRSTSSAPFAPPLLPPLFPLRAPVLPELRELLAPPVTQSASEELPPAVPDAPSAGTYEPEDDSRTVTDEPLDTQAHAKRFETTLGASTDAAVGLYVNETTEVDPTHLEQLRFGASVPLHLTASISSHKWPESSRSGYETGNVHTYQRHDALVARRLRRGDGWQSIELQCRQGPSLSGSSGESQMEWLHIQSECMTLTILEDYCLSAPNITQELQHVVARLFEKIAKTHCRQYFDGYLLTPGVVLRWDGSTPGYKKEQSLTASFVCFPYLTLQSREIKLRHDGEGFPSRSVLQTLYPYDSTSKQDMPPSFSKIAPSAADRVMLVPQVWCVSIGHKYLVTYTQLTLAELCEDTVLIGQQAPMPEHVVQNWKPDKEETLHPTKGKKEQGGSTKSSDTVEEVRLFEGKRVEDFEVTEFAETREHRDTPMPPTPRKASTWHVFSDTIEMTAPASWLQRKAADAVDDPSTSKLEQRATSPPLRRRSVGPLPTQATHDEAPSSTPVDSGQPSVDDLKSMSLMFSTIDEPEMTTEYMHAFQTCLASLLKVWPNVFPRGPSDYDNELQQVHLSLQIAEKLDKVLILEEGNPKLAAKTEYRISLMNLLGLHSVEQELSGLSNAIKTVLRLLRHSGTEDARKVFANNKFEDENTVERKIEDLKNIAKGSFLAWPWIINDAANYTNSPHDAAVSLAENFTRILQDSDEHIRRRNEKSSYLGADRKALSDLERSMHDLRASLATFADVDPTPTGSQRTRSAHLGVDHSLASKKRREITVAVIQSLVMISKDLVGLFVPCDFPHPMLEKIWGSLVSSLQIMMQPFEPNVGAPQTSCVIRRLDDLSRPINPPLPDVTLDNCAACQAGQVYVSAAEAIMHLRVVHFRHAHRNMSDDHLRAQWIQSADVVRRHLTNDHHLRLVELYIDYLTMLHARAKEIHERTAIRGDGDAGCTLPRGLVECFETITLFTVQISTIAFGMQSEMDCRPLLPTDDCDLQMDNYALTRLGPLGKTAQQAMSRAEKALILSDPAATVELGPAGPDLLIAVVLHNIQKKALLPDDEQRNYALYHNYASRLVYQINQFPRRRLLHDIQVLQEELDVVRRVNDWQHQCVANLMIILDPRYFPRPTKDRIAMFPAERSGLQRTLDYLDIEAGELEALDHRVHDLRNQLRQSVEILEEDHGKAIFVFTMVTTIFLPLSFVSSFFGMNFADIRDMEKRQSVFWVTALPVTAGIIVIAVFLANHGDKVLEMTVQLLQQLKGQEQPSSMLAISESEESVWNRSSTVLPQARSMKQRRGLTLRR